MADQYGFKIGDVIPIRGTIYPGEWSFVVRGIFDGADDTKITRHMLFHWEALNEWLIQRGGRAANSVGVFIVTIDKPEQLAPLVRGMAKPGDIVMCLGAGTITQWAYALPGQLEAFDKALEPLLKK